ncbi:MAG: 30S ribosomal protein S16 [Bdellovibrionales bacterium]|nr:30S ribosomal protein S16 [Bdellovibrionales bacterium]
MVVIRLARTGSKHNPSYRVTVADQRSAVRGRYIEVIGHYHPLSKDKNVLIDKKRYDIWIQKGAQPSRVVANLYKKLKPGKEDAPNGTQGNRGRSH